MKKEEPIASVQRSGSHGALSVILNRLSLYLPSFFLKSQKNYIKTTHKNNKSTTSFYMQQSSVASERYSSPSHLQQTQVTFSPKANLLTLPNEVSDLIYSYIHQHDANYRYTTAKPFRMRLNPVTQPRDFKCWFASKIPCLDFCLASNAAMTSFKQYLSSSEPSDYKTWQAQLIFDNEDNNRDGPTLIWARCSFTGATVPRNLEITVRLKGLDCSHFLPFYSRRAEFRRKDGSTPRASGSRVLRDVFQIINLIIHRGESVISSRQLASPLRFQHVSIDLRLPVLNAVSAVPRSNTLFPHRPPSGRWGVSSANVVFERLADFLDTISEERFFVGKVASITVDCQQIKRTWRYTEGRDRSLQFPDFCWGVGRNLSRPVD